MSAKRTVTRRRSARSLIVSPRAGGAVAPHDRQPCPAIKPSAPQRGQLIARSPRRGATRPRAGIARPAHCPRRRQRAPTPPAAFGARPGGWLKYSPAVRTGRPRTPCTIIIAGAVSRSGRRPPRGDDVRPTATGHADPTPARLRRRDPAPRPLRRLFLPPDARRPARQRPRGPIAA